jgi:rhamnose utilization protein RhaD (predicted bifunctional aldolase and dehydrogenase)
MLNKLFVQLSADIGLDRYLVQGAGGNTSLKENNMMHIKASGKWLANAKKEDIFVLVDSRKVQQNIKGIKDDPLKGALIGKTNLRPSIETTLHALMPHNVVVHTHPVQLLNWLVLEDGQKRLTKVLKDVNWAWVPYARPGVELTYEVQKAMYNRHVDVILLGNHGLVVGGENCSVVSSLMDRVLNRCKTSSRGAHSKYDHAIEELAGILKMRLPRHNQIHSLALDHISYKYCNNKNGILYPDQAVFLGSKMPCYDGEMNKEGVASYLEENGSMPFIILKGRGVLVSLDAKIDVDEMLLCHSEILRRIGDNETLSYLTEREVGRLLNWDLEKYRQTMDK